jgi:ATP-dependent protease ClpP protease subunit
MVANRCKNEYSKLEFWSAILSDNKPNYYTSEEALEMGLIDEVA